MLPVKPADVPRAVTCRRQVLQCCQAARLLRRQLGRLCWADLSPADRRELRRSLRALSSDIALAHLITGGDETAKAAAP